jgi:quercetin dioxygenase-like cupin family protein
MSTHHLRFHRDTHPAGARVNLPSCIARILFIEQGVARIRAARTAAGLGPNAACLASGETEVLAAGETIVHRWELHRVDATPDEPADLVAPISLDAGTRWLIRCDRVDFPPGGVAWTHTHRGPGIRCLLEGTIRVEVNGHGQDIVPGQPWFEAGPDPVLAIASTTVPSAFARVMVLPAELLGRSSIRYELPEDHDKPKRQSYRLLIDEPIDT